jgi:hypothetical protein
MYIAGDWSLAATIIHHLTSSAVMERPAGDQACKRGLQANHSTLLVGFGQQLPMTLDSNSLVLPLNVWCAVPALDLLGSFVRIEVIARMLHLGSATTCGCAAACGLLRNMWTGTGRTARLLSSIQACKHSSGTAPVLVEGCTAQLDLCDAVTQEKKGCAVAVVTPVAKPHRMLLLWYTVYLHSADWQVRPGFLSPFRIIICWNYAALLD